MLLAVALCFDSPAEFGRLDDRLRGYWLYTCLLYTSDAADE